MWIVRNDITIIKDFHLTSTETLLSIGKIVSLIASHNYKRCVVNEVLSFIALRKSKHCVVSEFIGSQNTNWLYCKIWFRAKPKIWTHKLQINVDNVQSDNVDICSIVKYQVTAADHSSQATEFMR